MSIKVLHTIGYEGSSINDFLVSLKAAAIDLLIDVRDVPISRKPGFSKTALSKGLETLEIEYLHLKGLGDPKLGRLAAREGRYDDFRQIFLSHMKSTVAQADLMRALDEASRKTTCLLCFERDHTQCHRCMVAEEMARHCGLKLVHLGVQSSSIENIQKKWQRRHDGARALIG